MPSRQEWSSLTGRSPTRLPSTPISVTPAMCWTGSMLLAGSPLASPWCADDLQRRQPAGIKPAFGPPRALQPLPRTCSEPASLCYAEPTTSTNTTRPASPSSSPPTQGCEPADRDPLEPSKIRTPRRPLPAACMVYRRRPRWRPGDARLLEALDRFTRPLRHRRTWRVPLTSSTPSLPGATRSWPGTVRAGPPTAESKGPPHQQPPSSLWQLLFDEQVLRRVAHGFTNPNNFAARGLLVT